MRGLTNGDRLPILGVPGRETPIPPVFQQSLTANCLQEPFLSHREEIRHIRLKRLAKRRQSRRRRNLTQSSRALPGQDLPLDLPSDLPSRNARNGRKVLDLPFFLEMP